MAASIPTLDDLHRLVDSFKTIPEGMIDFKRFEEMDKDDIHDEIVYYTIPNKDERKFVKEVLSDLSKRFVLPSRMSCDGGVIRIDWKNQKKRNLSMDIYIGEDSEDEIHLQSNDFNIRLFRSVTEPTDVVNVICMNVKRTGEK